MTTDSVALDQACIDLVYAQRNGDGASLVNRIESRSGLHTLEHAEEIGLGSRVNAVHSKLSKQIPEDSGRAPAARYLDYNTILFWWLEDNAHLSVTEKVDKLKEIISTPQNLGKLDAKTLSQKELTINTKGLFPTKV